MSPRLLSKVEPSYTGADFGTPFDLSCRVIGLQCNRRGGRCVGESPVHPAVGSGACPQRSASLAGLQLVAWQAITGKLDTLNRKTLRLIRCTAPSRESP